MTGTLITRQFASESLGAIKNVRVYLPAGYDAATKRYPVFYYLHGAPGSETTWTADGKLDTAADSMGLQAIIVMPDGGESFYVGADETYIAHDLVAWVDSTFRTIPKREGRVIAGMSAGGYGALHIAMRHHDLFCAVAAHSPVATFASRDESFPEWRDYDPMLLAETFDATGLAIYLDVGTEDRLAPDVLRLHQLLLGRNIEHAFYTGPGRHNFAFAIERGPKSLAFLQGHAERPVDM
jgi:S-formylglutathione hydrolase FrmB